MKGVVLVITLLLPACALTDSQGSPDMGGLQLDGGRRDGEADQSPPSCFHGTPATEEQLLNQCTDAQHIDRAGRVPPNLWDGKGPLPPAP